ncbi:MAG TPA: 3',5'-cyclic-nucleotide phosphodiesterase, partial [Puia sp.]|nr:3',5'-cyclic-nucleotide phosphodiesterase [Puia sp.]
APENSNNYICLDAGTIRFGIQQSINNQLFRGNIVSVLRSKVKAYLISHPHLDHVAGLVINAPDDTAKNIYALPFCIDVLKEKYFTWKSWANFANEGDKPALNKYHYSVMGTNKETAIENTEMYVRPFLLSHANPSQSTAFLVRTEDVYLLYFGDTGSDEIEKSNKLELVWNFIAPLIKSKKLKAIFIETSFPDEQQVKQLFGHLTPSLLMKEMIKLNSLAGNGALENFPVVITHIKPTTVDSREKIIKELEQLNSLHLKLIFPNQGEKLEF